MPNGDEEYRRKLEEWAKKRWRPPPEPKRGVMVRGRPVAPPQEIDERRLQTWRELLETRGAVPTGLVPGGWRQGLEMHGMPFRRALGEPLGELVTRPFRPEVKYKEPRMRPPTEVEKAKGDYRYKPTLAAMREYEEWKEKLPWLKKVPLEWAIEFLPDIIYYSAFPLAGGAQALAGRLAAVSGRGLPKVGALAAEAAVAPVAGFEAAIPYALGATVKTWASFGFELSRLFGVASGQYRKLAADVIQKRWLQSAFFKGMPQEVQASQLGRELRSSHYYWTKGQTENANKMAAESLDRALMRGGAEARYAQGLRTTIEAELRAKGWQPPTARPPTAPKAVAPPKPVVKPKVPEVKVTPEVAEPTYRVLGRTQAGEANLVMTDEGVLLERIAIGKKKGWWKTIIGETEYVAQTRERVLEIARERGAILPKAKAITPEAAIPKRPAVEKVEPVVTPAVPPKLPPESVALGRTPSEWTGSMADLQGAETVADIAFRNDVVRKWINLLPEIKGLIRILNPTAVANTPAERSISVRAVLRDEGKQKSQGLIAHLNELGTQEKIFGKVAEDGTIASGILKGIHPNDIRTYPQRYKLTNSQKQWIERANDIEKAKLDFLIRNGIEINELAFEEGGRYAGRRVWAKVVEGEVLDTAYVGAGPGRIGAKLAVEKRRTFKTAAEAVQAGYRYLPEDEALYLNVQGAYNRVADRQMADWLLTQVPWRTTGAPEELVLAAEAAKLKYRHSQQLLAALNRAVRGERIPDVTINSIARSYPEQAKTLKNLIPRIQEGAPTAKRVQNLTRVAKGLIDSNKSAMQRAVNARARAREKALRVGFEEAVVPAPAFAGKILTGPEAKETTRVLKESFEPGFSKALGAINKANAVARYFMLAGDISPMTIQLIFLMGENPVIYGKAFAGLTNSLFDPQFHSSYLAKHKATIDKHPNLLLTKAGATEFTEAMARGGWLSGEQTLLPEAENYWKSLALILPRVGAKVGGTVLTPFQRGFETALDVAGIEMAEAYEYMGTTPKAMADLDQFINEFRGVTSSARIGVSSFQQQLETTCVLAPRYNRAIAGLLFDSGRGGIRGSLARKALAKGITALSVMAVVISIARGETKDEILDHFNPNSSNFFTWEIAGQKIGPGSKVRSVVKLFAQSVSNPESLFQFSMDNPGLRFVRGNLSPVVSAGVDLVTGRSYIGDPTRDGMLSFSKEILGGNLLPIWMQSVLLEGGDLKGRTARGLAEFFGGRGYPEPLWDEVGRLRDKYAKADLNVKYEDLNRQQVDTLRRNHPDLIDLEERAGLEGAKRGTEFEKWYSETKKQIVEERNTALEQAAVALLSDLMSKRDYDQERKYARPYYSGGMAVLWGARESLRPYDVKRIEKWMGENLKPEDKALDKYLEYRGNLIARADLPKDWDKIEAQSTAYLSQFSMATRAYVLYNKNRWIESLPANAQKVERMRLAGIEDETWWDNYGGTEKVDKATRDRLEFLKRQRITE